MADDLIQRPYRSNDTIARASSKPAGNAGGDPLAELARLIGQNDPFAEFGRTQPVAPQPPAPPAAPPLPKYDFTSPVAPPPPPPDSQGFAPPNFARAPLGGVPHAGDDDLYHVEGGGQSFAPGPQGGGFPNDGYQHDQAQHAPENYDDYEDVAPKRRGMGITLIAGVIGLAVIGSAGAFGYRAIFGKSGSSAPPPVIKADTAPSKIMPTGSRDGAATKVSDRVGGDSERLVSREEAPIDIKDRTAAAFPAPVDQGNASMPVQGSGVVTPDPKRVRTITIHPDGSVAADAMPTSAPPPQAMPAAAAPARVTTIAAPARTVSPQPPVQQMPPPQPPKRMAAAAPQADPDADTAKPAATLRVPPPVAQHQAAAPAPKNAPMSLSPDAAEPRPAAAPRAQPAARTAPAALASAPAVGGAGGYAVQVSAQRSEAEAQAAFRSLQGKYPEQLGSRQAMIHKVDLGAKGIFYRAMVPAGTGAEASELCSSLKAAGGSCLIQRN